MRYVPALGLILALAWSSMVLAGTTKVIELKDGSAIVGEVIDEGDTGYLIKKRDGTTVRVKYDDIEEVSVLSDDGGGSGSAAPAGDDLDSLEVDGFVFPDKRSALEYSSRRVLLDVYDLRSGSWSNVSRTRSSSGGQQWDLGQPLSAGLSRVTGTAIDVGFETSAQQASAATVSASAYQETLDRGYRIVTGAGLVLTEFGKRPESLRLPESMEAILSEAGKLGVVERCSKTPHIVAVQDETFFAYIVQERPADFFVELPESERARRKREKKGKEPPLFLCPHYLTVAEMLPYISEYNEQLAASLGAE